MKHRGALHSLIFAAALAAAPVMAQPGSRPAAPATTATTATAAAATPADSAAPAVPPAASATAPASTAAPAERVPASDPAAAPAATATAAPGAAAAPPGPNDTTMAPNPARPAQLGVPAQPYSAAPPSGGLMQTTLALFFVIALLLGGAWFLKRFGPRNFGGGNNTVKLVGALSVGTRERILVVEVGEQWIVVGASPGRMNALATMPRQQSPDTADAPAPNALPAANFAAWIKHTLDKRNGKPE